jgi:DNA-binding response OmpR family regulator
VAYCQPPTANCQLIEVPVILVVEDDPQVARLISLVLQRNGHQSEIVADGESALDKVKAKRPVMIFADLTIKGLNGEALCSTLKARVCGADDYMGKPFEFDDLIRLVNKYAKTQS